MILLQTKKETMIIIWEAKVCERNHKYVAENLDNWRPRPIPNTEEAGSVLRIMDLNIQDLYFILIYKPLQFTPSVMV